MDIESYAFDSNNEKLNNNNVSLLHVNDNYGSTQANMDKGNKVQWKESLDPNSYETSRSSMLNAASPFQNSLECTEVHDITKRSNQEENSPTKGDYQPREQPRKGRASLIRLQAAEGYTGSSGHADSDFAIASGNSSNQSSRNMSNNTWMGPPCKSSFSTDNSITDTHYASTTSEIQESADFLSSDAVDFDDIPNNQDIQKYLTTDGQYVYGYKNSNGEFHFFYPSLNDRERHNEKERRRRSRVSGVCKSLRQIVPGLSEKIDKASVFEHTARYLQFLRDKYGTQFDQDYCEKYFLFGRKESVSSESMHM